MNLNRVTILVFTTIIIAGLSIGYIIDSMASGQIRNDTPIPEINTINRVWIYTDTTVTPIVRCYRTASRDVRAGFVCVTVSDIKKEK